MANNENPTGLPVENTPTQTLFRFVSLRSPQLSDEKGQDKRFVLIPEELKDDTKFYKPVTEGTGTKRKLLQERATAYEPTAECISKDKPTNNLDSFKRSYKVIYDFASWLARNKSTCTYQEFVSKRDEVLATQYTVPSDVVLWNNLIYQVVTQKDFYIKEVIMQMILALHTLRNPSNTEDETKILLNARVVLPKELMLDEETLPVSQSVSKMASNEPKESYPSEEMRQQQEISSAKMKLSRIEGLKKNLSAVEKKYNKEYQAEYQSQDEAYQRQIAPIITAYNEAVEAAREEYCGVRPPGTEYDPKDPCQQPKTVPYPTLPKFDFTFRDEVSAENLVTSLKPENVETLLDVLGHKFDPQNISGRAAGDDTSDLDNLLEGKNTFLELTSVINENVEKLNNVIVENTQANEESYTSIGGIIIPTAKTLTFPFIYQICTRPLYKSYVLDLSLTVPDASWDISYVSYALTPNNTNTEIFGDYYVKSKTGNTIFLKDMYNQGLDFSTIQDSAIRIKVAFTNGQVTEFGTGGLSPRYCVSGDFALQVDENENPEIIDDEKDFIPSGFGFKNIGVADYLKVEQSTHAYVEGEVAHIENVMAREYREKSTRRLRRSENTSTTSSDTEREQINDTTTANRFEMQSEISKMMQEATDIGISGHFDASWKTPGGNANFSTGIAANYANHKSKEESTRQATTQAQDITSRAMDRIVNKVHEERIEKIIEEFEETNSHGLDNRKGDKHVVGVYRWVDKLMKNQIYNYGKRMMFEFMIPEPAKLHLLGMAIDKSANQTSLVKPEDPRTSSAMPMKDYSYLSNEAVLKYWISKYNVEIDNKPEETKTVGVAFATNNNSKEGGFTKSTVEKVQIPEGYYTTNSQINIGYEAEFGPENNLGQGWQAITVANNKQVANELGVIKPMPNYTQEVPVSYFSVAQHGQVSAVIIYLAILPEYKNAWLRKTFNAIITAYEEALVEYNNKLSEEQNKAVVIKDSNPNFYRQIENTVLRKNCISYMADRAVGSTHGYGLTGLTQGSTFTDYETNLTSKLDKYTAFVKFMEQAFEWENLSYYLYPYYWGNKQNWTDLYQAENTDPLFRAFLQSGMARVVATVRPGFEDVVQFYLATGKIWNGGEVPVIGDELYLSIVDEMKEPKGIKQGKAWLTRLPTTLNILQAESIGLKVAHALPFTTENPDDFEVPSEVITKDKFNFEKNENLLGIQDNTTEKIITGDWL
ncbi:hypothetical protein [Chryseobacterium limigenitum]|uniref:Uncharacterized protein n=1 Tax=Chryseobacterium limigenitum TaxID=1612149 RepID=A0A1K2ITQ8_9FLAO|nr:hypothetical protein [Chryseobacterium limigenitum]SFZ95107.1 hypothetical protein SAMN05216324_108146 [Chryseobacterium limigenitum]